MGLEKIKEEVGGRSVDKEKRRRKRGYREVSEEGGMMLYKKKEQVLGSFEPPHTTLEGEPPVKTHISLSNSCLLHGFSPESPIGGT